MTGRTAPKGYWHARRDAIYEAIKEEVHNNPESALAFLDTMFDFIYDSCARVENNKIKVYVRSEYGYREFDTVEELFNNSPYEIENIAVHLSLNQKNHFHFHKDAIPKSVLAAMRKYAITEKAIKRWQENL